MRGKRHLLRFAFVRVLILTSTFPRWQDDSEPPFILELSKRLKDQGHDLTVVAPHAPGALRQELLDGLDIRRFRYFIPRYQRLCYGGGIPANLRRSWLARMQVPTFFAAEFLTVLRQTHAKFDIIHAHWVIPHGWIASLVKKLTHAKLLISAHGSDVFTFNSTALKSISRFALRSADAITANSTASADVISSISGIYPEVIPMGVDLEAFSAGGANVPHHNTLQDFGRPLILFVGRLGEEKGLSYLIKAMPRFLEANPEAALLVIGDGPQRETATELAASLGVTSRVRFLGAVPNKSIPPYFWMADAVAVPSLREGLGVVLLESAAAGVPAVASAVGGIADIIEHEKTGLLVPPRDSDSLADALVRLTSNPKLSKRLVEAAKFFVAQNFSWDAVAQKFDRLYRQLSA